MFNSDRGSDRRWLRKQPKLSQPKSTRKLRKQPKVRRAEATAPALLPKVVIPKTAKKRRTRNKRTVQLPSTALKRVVTSSRWISLSLLAICVAALVLIGTDDSFYLDLIPVEGAATIPPSEIVQASGLSNIHIFSADPNAAAAKIQALPGVISTTVMLEWPNQVQIKVAEEAPIAVWEQGGQQYWVDENGRLIPARVRTVGLLLIQSEINEPLEDVDFIPTDVLDGALQLKALRPNIDQLYYRPAGGLSYHDGRGWRVYFGIGEDMAQKLTVYERIVEDLLDRGLTPEYVSVSNQERPYYKSVGSS
ncbi:MAG: FtsQ-type POTRA domain-containing protein [Candidatus Promineifilaceae bacterium]